MPIIKSLIIFIFYCNYIITSELLNTVDKTNDFVRDDDDDENYNKNKSNNHKKKFNFALNTAGAVILAKSPANAKYSSLLNNDQDEYAISPCSEKKWVVIGLSEDIVISEVVIANYEKYSSKLKDFQLLTTAIYPTEEWINLGHYQARPILGEQPFNVTRTDSHVRYLKIKFLTHYDNEHYCTISQIKVHGTTVIASLTEEFESSDSYIDQIRGQLTLDAESVFDSRNHIENYNHSNDLIDSDINNNTDSQEEISVNTASNQISTNQSDEQTDDININDINTNDIINSSIDQSIDYELKSNDQIDSTELINKKDIIENLIKVIPIPVIPTIIEKIFLSDNDIKSNGSSIDVIDTFDNHINSSVQVVTDTNVPIDTIDSSTTINESVNNSIDREIETNFVSVDEVNNDSGDNIDSTIIDSNVDNDLTNDSTIGVTESQEETVVVNLHDSDIDTVDSNIVSESENTIESEAISDNDLSSNITTDEATNLPNESPGSSVDNNDIISNSSNNVNTTTNIITITTNSSNNISSFSNQIDSDNYIDNDHNLLQGPINKVSNASFNNPLTRIQCYELLKYYDYYMKMFSKFESKYKSNGSTSDSVSDVSGNVFKQLMKRIKNLELNYAILESYTAQLSECYQSILVDTILAVNQSIKFNQTVDSGSINTVHNTPISSINGTNYASILNMFFRTVIFKNQNFELTNEEMYNLIIWSWIMSIVAILVTISLTCCILLSDNYKQSYRKNSLYIDRVNFHSNNRNDSNG